MINPNKSSYHGQLFSTLILILPPVLLTALFFGTFSLYDRLHGNVELNWVSSKLFGCGLGIIFHISCWLMSAFKKDFQVVKNRVKEFFSDIVISPKLAFVWYWDDIKETGVAFWIDLAVIVANVWIFIASIFEYMAITS